MSETPNLRIPLVAAAQAQKHVTVNEALSRIDAALQLRIVSRSEISPPVAYDGHVYLVPENAEGDWIDQDGKLAFGVGEGWDFLFPHPGWRVWVDDEAAWIVFDGDAWATGAIATSASGAATRASVIEVDYEIVDGGPEIVTEPIIPEGSIVQAVTGRIVDGFDGALSDWSLGVAGSSDRYGSGLGATTAAYVRGLTGQPQAYYAETGLVMTANGGDFGTGTIRLALHVMQFDLPRL